MSKKMEKFSEDFVKELGEFVGKQKAKAKKQGLSNTEVNAVITLACKILGKNAEQWAKMAQKHNHKN